MKEETLVTYLYEDYENEDDSMMENTASMLNTELEYMLAGYFDVSIDTIEFVSRIGLYALIDELKIYRLFNGFQYLEPHKEGFKALDTMLGEIPAVYNAIME